MQKNTECPIIKTNKIQRGDYKVLGLMLGCSNAAAIKRVYRGNKEACNALQKIITTRKQLIQEFQSKKK